jgi:hypothetical protein
MLPRTHGRPRRQIARLSLALIALAALAMPAGAAAAPTASKAATATGSLQLLVGGNGKAARALSSRSVKVRAVKPATKRGAQVSFPVASVAVERSATVRLRGALVFKAGRRTVKLRSLKAKLTARKATITARVGKQRGVKVLTAGYRSGEARLNAAGDAAALESARIGLTPRGAKLLRKKLRLSGFPSGPLGVLSLDAVAGGGTRGGGTGGTGGGGIGGPGGPGTGGPGSGPIKNEPPVLTRPTGAVNITSASLTWRPRVSWLCYVEEASVFGGAANGPAEPVACGSSQRDLVASFHGFPFKSGWYEASTGKAAIYFEGGLGFRYKAHGINFSSANPEIELNGTASRAIFTFNGTEGTAYDNQRGVLVDLHPNAIQAPPSGAVTYDNIPATVPEDAGASVFAGFYPANDPFGTMSVSFTTP